MNLTQLLIFELGTGCNLSHVHRECPNRSPLRYAALDTTRAMNDDEIVTIAAGMYQRHGFTGLVGWHYYNEPLLYRERMFSLMARIRAGVPESRFLLWTNGLPLPADCERFSIFERIYISDYYHSDWSRILGHGRVTLIYPSLDDRLDVPRAGGDAPCLRPFTEFICDYYGNVHLCCFDWQGQASPGNILATGTDEMVRRWQAARAEISGRRMTEGAPVRCRTCGWRQRGITNFDLAAHDRAEAWRTAQC